MSLLSSVKDSAVARRALYAASAFGIVGLVGLTAASAQSISYTGPFSWNNISTTNSKTVTVTKTNNVSVSNLSEQVSSSGNAEVKENTVGGSATSGSSSNTYSNTTTVDITNK